MSASRSVARRSALVQKVGNPCAIIGGLGSRHDASGQCSGFTQRAALGWATCWTQRMSRVRRERPGPKEHLWGRGQEGNRDASPLQVGNAANVVAGEKLLAPDTHPGEDRDRTADLNSRQQVGAVMGTEIGVVLCERRVDLLARFPFDMADVGEPFGAQ